MWHVRYLHRLGATTGTGADAFTDAFTHALATDAFATHAFAQVIHHRAPLYAAMARNWGVTVTAADVETVRDAQDAEAMIAAAIPA